MAARDGTVQVNARRRQGDCTYCRGDLTVEEPQLTCPDCGAAYHSDCLRVELGRCATFGCRYEPPGVPPQVKARLIKAGDGPRIGSRRACHSCGQAFLVEEGNRFNSRCAPCTRKQYATGLIAFVLASIIFLLANFGPQFLSIVLR